MKNKRILVLGIALVLMAMIVGVAFATTNTDGVLWAIIEGKSNRLSSQPNNNYMELYNSNNYPVKVTISTRWNVNLDAGETKHIAVLGGTVLQSSWTVTNVVRR